MDWDIDVWRRVKYAVVTAVLTFGLTATVAVAMPPSAAGPGFPGALIPLIAVVGWFVVTPLILLLGVPFGGDEAETDDRDPLERLRDRYAAGEISEAEFDRKVDRLLETDVERAPGATAGTDAGVGDPSLADLDRTSDAAASGTPAGGTGSSGTTADDRGPPETPDDDAAAGDRSPDRSDPDAEAAEDTRETEIETE